MIISETEYLGELRTQNTHLRSGDKIITDAPPDNNGKGEAFSPTDLAATSLLACMITVMGIAANKAGLDMGELKGTVDKVMAENPRRISAIRIHLSIRNNHLSEEKRKHLESVGLNCPVAKSLHPDIRQEISFKYE